MLQHAPRNSARAHLGERRRLRPADAGDLERLVAAAAAGDESAWATLVRRFQPQLVRVARTLGLHPQEAEDAAQETWLRFARSIEGIRDPRALAGWLTTTARHESLRVRTRTAREQPTADDLQAEAATTDESIARLDAAARSAAVTRALGTLPPRHQQLLRALFDEAAGSYREIAAQLDIPVGSIGPIRGRCLEQLRRDGRLRDLAEAS